MSNTTCPHLDKVANAVNTYNIVLAYYVTCIAEDAYKKKAADTHCLICKKNRRIHACLECAFFGCFDPENGLESHMKDHYSEIKHCVAININHGCLFCFECNDYIYNETFEDILNQYKLEARRIHGNKFYMPWKPKAEEIALLKDKIKKISDSSKIGLRGIVNIRNSCYINVIIQVFIHNPLLRDFFLSDKHMCFLKENCLACEMFVLFQEFYSGISPSYNPSERFFVVLQKYIKDDKVLGEDQADAHELFQKVLIGLHDSCEERQQTDLNARCEETHQTDLYTSCEEIRQIDNCNCMIHQIFYGINQISKTCSQCLLSSNLPLDHFMDIVLNLDRDGDSLVEILNRKFLKSQLLSDHECSNCKKINTTHLHQTIKKLPNVICFYMNCFIVHKEDGKSKTKKEQKIDKKSTAVAFEEWIDMSPYLNSKGDMLSNENRYRLFAVIFHKKSKGDIDQGHYSIYVRQHRNRWYECNDECVNKRSWNVVSACEPLFLFYYK